MVVEKNHESPSVILFVQLVYKSREGPAQDVSGVDRQSVNAEGERQRL
jgi:hypothetical protein